MFPGLAMFPAMALAPLPATPMFPATVSAQRFLSFLAVGPLAGPFLALTGAAESVPLP